MDKFQIDSKESELRKEIDDIQTYEESLHGKKEDNKDLLINEQQSILINQMEVNKHKENDNIQIINYVNI